ncbi:MAG: segregation/condensation protein A [Evtepia gabavorous]
MGMFSQLAQGVDWSSMGAMALRIVAVLLCLVVHEVCHGLAAYWLGDPTAKQSHRLSLNPIHHLDPFGLLMMVVVGFGWAKPVPVDPATSASPSRVWPSPRWPDRFPTSCWPMCRRSFTVDCTRCWWCGETTGLALALEFFGVLVTLNIGLGIFNLIPFPPLDGSKVVAMFLSDRQYVQWMRLERYGMIVLMAALWFGLLDGFLGTARSWMLDWMLRGPPSPTPGCSPADVTAMERPVYYIKGVVRDGAEATQDFMGPLDLILHLLQKNRIAVRDIPLAGILAQFLTWMSSRRALDLEVAGEFISMASHLMLLKTRMLLSEQDQEAQSEMEELIAPWRPPAP